MKRYEKWLLNAPMNKKFIPAQVIVLLFMIIVGLISVVSITTMNHLSKKVFAENVENSEMLHNIVDTMYICRVLGRDILFQDDVALRKKLYDRYIDSFKSLDLKMDRFAKNLSGKRLNTFKSIIASKEIYKKTMILSADLKNEGGKESEALTALRDGTPITAIFFDGIHNFLSDEQKLMANFLDKNNSIAMTSLALGLLINILSATLFLFLIQSIKRTMNKSLGSLEKAVSEITNTCDMNINIPEHLFTKDEIGSIAIAINKLKSMLLDNSYKCGLTNGYNNKAYYKEIEIMFKEEKDNNSQMEFWCIISDLNNLKLINDKFGHNDGDIAIRDVHSIMNSCFSKYGKIFRTGGDEFISILPDCSKEEIELAITEMKLKIKEKAKETQYDFSIAFGYGEFKGNTKEEFKECLKIIDRRMYQNKILTKKIGI